MICDYLNEAILKRYLYLVIWVSELQLQLYYNCTRNYFRIFILQKMILRDFLLFIRQVCLLIAK